MTTVLPTRESVHRLNRTSCLAGIGPTKVAMFTAILRAAGVPLDCIERVDVASIGKKAPALLICDLDGLDTDPLETLRQLRFVLPACVIVVYTRTTERVWSMACHLAGASGLLSKASSKRELAAGIRSALDDGCFTDPRFAAAS